MEDTVDAEASPSEGDRGIALPVMFTTLSPFRGTGSLRNYRPPRVDVIGAFGVARMAGLTQGVSTGAA